MIGLLNPMRMNQLAAQLALIAVVFVTFPGLAENDAAYDPTGADEAPELTEEAEKAIQRGALFEQQFG